MQTDNRKTILVIDDDLITLDLMQSTLNVAGYNAVIEAVPEKAFHFLEQNHVDLILLDILMPKMDGFQLCSILKSKPDYENIPVIFLTALADQESMSNSFEVGAVDFITKPFAISELLARINVYLHLSENNNGLNIHTRNPLICTNCSNIWDNKSWLEVTEYLTQYSKVVINTELCPTCESETNYPEAPTTQTPLNQDSNGKQSEILIIDDHIESIELLGQILVKNNYKVLSAESGKKVLSLIKVKQPDLILLDIMMPEMDGYEVCKELKSNTLTKDIPVIFLTAKAESDALTKGFRVGANDFITKPFLINEVLARVRAQIEFKRLKDLLNQQESSITVCNQCKNIKLYQQDWISFEKMFRTSGAAMLMYTICPECMDKKYQV